MHEETVERGDRELGSENTTPPFSLVVRFGGYSFGLEASLSITFTQQRTAPGCSE
jgi:hypothetical protein